MTLRQLRVSVRASALPAADGVMRPRLVLFDCDGTLVDSAAVIAGAMAHAFLEHGLPAPAAADVRTIIGLSLPGAVAMLCAQHPQAPLEALAAAYKRAYRDTIAGPVEREPAFPGTHEALAQLDDETTVLGIVTGKSRAGLARVLAGHRLAERFAVTVTADDAPSKPAPDMVLAALAATGVDAERTVVVGDTTFDMEMARAAGAFAIGVSWGYHMPAALGAAGAHAMVERMSALPALVNALVPRV